MLARSHYAVSSIHDLSNPPLEPMSLSMNTIPATHSQPYLPNTQSSLPTSTTQVHTMRTRPSQAISSPTRTHLSPMNAGNDCRSHSITVNDHPLNTGLLPLDIQPSLPRTHFNKRQQHRQTNKLTCPVMLTRPILKSPRPTLPLPYTLTEPIIQSTTLTFPNTTEHNNKYIPDSPSHSTSSQ